jgi:mycothiol system anti-sigma-R factor
LSGIDCEEALRDLQAYIDDELPAGRALLIEEHISDCSPCLDRGEFQRRLQEIVRTKCGGSVPVPAHLSDRVRRLIGG